MAYQSFSRTRIFAGFGAAGILIMITLGALAYTQLRAIQRTAARLTGDTMPIYLIGEVQSITLDLYAIAMALEQAGTAGQLDRRSQLLPRAVDAFDRFRSTLERAGWV